MGGVAAAAAAAGDCDSAASDWTLHVLMPASVAAPEVQEGPAAAGAAGECAALE